MSVIVRGQSTLDRRILRTRPCSRSVTWAKRGRYCQTCSVPCDGSKGATAASRRARCADGKSLSSAFRFKKRQCVALAGAHDQKRLKLVLTVIFRTSITKVAVFKNTI